MRILLLEDNSTDANLTRIELINSISDCTLEVVSTLKQAQEILKKETNFDIALLDMKLPDGNGLDLLIEIRQLGLNMAIVMLTGSGNEEVAVVALKSGADDYIVKNTDYISRLPGVIEFALKRYKQNLKQKSEIIEVLYTEHHYSDIDLTIRYFKQYAPFIKINAVTSAEEALIRLTKNNKESGRYNVILMDYRLPALNALEFIKKIRQELKLDIPIILITGQGNEEIAVQALKLGANDYLTKNENYLTVLPSKIIIEYQNNQLKKRQAQLVESELKYRLLADNSGDVIFVLDMDLNYTYISPAVKTLRGFEPEEAINQKITEVLTPDSLDKTRKIVSEILYENFNNFNNPVLRKSVELEMIRKDKSTVWTEVQASLIKDEHNTPAGVLGITRDITQRRHITNELRKLSRAVEQSPVSVVITDTEGIIEYVNPKFSQITGYSFDEVKGKNPRILKSGKTSKEEYRNLWHLIKSGKEWIGEFYNKRKDGTFYWEAATISPIVDSEGMITYFLAIKEDITEKKKTLGELIIAKEKAEESDRLKTAFLHNISHEIRTPLNAIIGFSEFLNDPEFSAEDRKDFSNIIRNSSDQLLSIIADLINIATIEAGQEKIQANELNVNVLCKFIYDQFVLKAQNKDIQFEYKTALPDSDALINTDETKIIQVLSNLVGNALKFTASGFVRFGYNVKDKYLEFFVKDSGIGIPPEMYEEIFIRFRQVENELSSDHGGTGLGLSISKAYVELLGGKIWVTSELEKGSDFSFTIPFKKVKTEELIQIRSVKEKTKELENPITILVAEDEDFNFLLFKRLFSKKNITILRAKDGQESVEICRSKIPIDLILMDLKMPIMNGFEATRLIREFMPDIPIIAQTAYTTDKDMENAFKCGCNDYISKPFKKEVLLSKIWENLKKT